jgi:hypothetical protein
MKKEGKVPKDMQEISFAQRGQIGLKQVPKQFVFAAGCQRLRECGEKNVEPTVQPLILDDLEYIDLFPQDGEEERRWLRYGRDSSMMGFAAKFVNNDK